MIPVLALLVAAAALAGPSVPVTITEVEPNSTKAAATPATLAPGGAVTGTSAGSDSNPVATGISTVDTYFVTLPQNPGIWRHRLTLTTSGPIGHALSIRGLTQTNGVVVAGTDVAAVTSSGTTTPARFVQCYGYGAAAPQMYIRVAGIGATSSPYRVTLASERVQWSRFPRVIPPGPVTISTVGQTTADTELILLDSAFNLLPGAVNDDTPAGPGTPARVQSTLHPTFTPGLFYLGVTDFDAVTSEPSPTDDANRSSPLLDFPGIVATASTLANLNLAFAITGATGPALLPAAGTTTKLGAFDILWFRLRVTCSLADVASLGGTHIPDGAITPDDLIVFLGAFFTNDLDSADVASLGGDPAPDGRTTPDDIIAFLGAFFADCP
ncbi:MAG: GC-type dockerin domain-anchored protein [Phycisphaerales bacterium]